MKRRRRRWHYLCFLYDTLFDRRQQNRYKYVFRNSYDTRTGYLSPKYLSTPILTHTCKNSYDAALSHGKIFMIGQVKLFKTAVLLLLQKLL